MWSLCLTKSHFVPGDVCCVWQVRCTVCDQVEELETKVKKAIEEMTRLEQQLSGVDREKKMLVDEAARLEQQLTQTSKDKQKVIIGR